MINKFNIQSISQGFMDLSGQIMSIASAIQSIGRLDDIWSDDTLTTGEKILQTIFAVANAANGLANVFKLVHTTAGILTGVTAASTVANTTNAESLRKVKNETNKLSGATSRSTKEQKKHSEAVGLNAIKSDVLKNSTQQLTEHVVFNSLATEDNTAVLAQNAAMKELSLNRNLTFNDLLQMGDNYKAFLKETRPGGATVKNLEQKGQEAKSKGLLNKDFQLFNIVPDDLHEVVFKDISEEMSEEMAKVVTDIDGRKIIDVTDVGEVVTEQVVSSTEKTADQIMENVNKDIQKIYEKEYNPFFGRGTFDQTASEYANEQIRLNDLVDQSKITDINKTISNVDKKIHELYEKEYNPFFGYGSFDQTASEYADQMLERSSKHIDFANEYNPFFGRGTFDQTDEEYVDEMLEKWIKGQNGEDPKETLEEVNEAIDETRDNLDTPPKSNSGNGKNGLFGTFKNDLEQIKVALAKVPKSVWIAAAAIAAIAITIKLVNFYAEENVLKRSLDHATESAKKTKEAYDELKSSIDDYSSTVEQINELKEGTVEFYEAIVAANEKALELIDTLSLLPSDYAIGEGGLIQFNEGVLDNALYAQLQASHRAQGNQLNAQANLQKYYKEEQARQFNSEVNALAFLQGAPTLSKSATDMMLESWKEDFKFDLSKNKVPTTTSDRDSDILLEYLKDGKEVADVVERTVDTQTGKLIENTDKNAINIQDAVVRSGAAYNVAKAKEDSYRLAAARSNIYGYLDRNSINRYEGLSEESKDEIDRYIADETQNRRNNYTNEAFL